MMKKLLALLLVAAFAVPAMAVEKKPAAKPAAVKKEVKHHKKFDGDKVPDAPAKKAPAKKK